MAEASIAVDPIHEAQPVKMMKALQNSTGALNVYATRILRNERAQIQSKDSDLQPVPDEGGREQMRSLILQMKAIRAFLRKKSFAALINTIAHVSSEDFIEAMNIVGPKEDMPSTMSRPDMQLYFSEVSGDIHGPFHFAPD